nr:7886_t:CDS:2 [Entrophospora candida]
MSSFLFQTYAKTSVSLPPKNLITNQENSKWIVQKFGGTSVGKFLEVIAENIVKIYLKSNRIAIVCSARSGETKAKGTTNRLLQAAEQAHLQDSKKYIDLVDEIKKDHIEASRDLIKNKEILKDLEECLEKDCDKLKSFLEAVQTIEEISPRSKDNIIGVGEKLSCRVVTAVLIDKGIDAELICLDNIIDHNEFDSNNLGQNFYNHLANRISEAVKNISYGRVPVITGYFGRIPGGLLNNIGRGYTDLCAALLAVGLKAEELQVWKEVDGIFTADPRKITNARLLPVVSPEEAAELTYYGSEVIHPFTMEQVIKAKIPIRIKNVMNPLGKGTVISPESNDLLICQELSYENSYQHDIWRKHPTAVTIKNNIIVLNIHSNRKTLSHGFFAQIFVTLDKYGIVVDLISTSEVHVSMALGADIVERDLNKAISELKKIGEVDILEDMAILSLVGRQMKNMVGIAGKMFTTLASSNVNIEMISQGASEINISCVIDEKNADRALKEIHEHLLNTPLNLLSSSTTPSLSSSPLPHNHQNQKSHNYKKKQGNGILGGIRPEMPTTTSENLVPECYIK